MEPVKISFIKHPKNGQIARIDTYRMDNLLLFGTLTPIDKKE